MLKALQRISNRVLIPIVALAAIMDGAFVIASVRQKPTIVPYCRAIDGDTLVCDGELIRLNGIDAPELPGHCRPGRRCVVGDPFAAKADLERNIRGGVIAITRLGKDRYGRTIGQVSVDGLDLSCMQIGAGGTEYVERWDNEHRTAGACD
jgi:micrococcal nuclease